jgi:predicted phage terminase large subunit-like protein
MVLEAEDIIRLLVLIPRGHFKTTLISIAYPLWCLCRNPSSRVALISVSADKAEENLADIRARARSETFQKYFSGVIGPENTWEEAGKGKIRIRRPPGVTGPSIAAYGVDSKEVGRHFDIMCLDDIVDQEKVNSPAVRDGVWRWFGRQLSVLDPGTKLLVLGTRWHYDDVYARILRYCPKRDPEHPDGWHIIHRKAIEDGKPIFPTRFTLPILNEIKQIQGDYLYSCFYNNEPVGEGFNPYDVRKFQFIDYVRPEAGRTDDERAQTPITHLFVDPAATDESYSCYSALVLADACWDHRVVIRGAWIEKIDPDILVDRIFQLVQEHGIYRVGIEDEVFQRSLVFWVRREQLLRKVAFQCIPIKIPRNVHRLAKLSAIQPFIHNGEIVFDTKMDGRQDLMEEFATFPKGAHDDIVSAMSMIPHASLFPSKRVALEAPPEKPHLVEFLDRICDRIRKDRNGRFPRLKVRSR